jgi:hypothetical protein
MIRERFIRRADARQLGGPVEPAHDKTGIRALVLGVVALSCFTGGAVAQSVTQELAKCAVIPEATARLACYDALAPRPETKARAFGAEQLPPNKAAAPAENDASISAHVGEILLTPFGRFVLVLDNGEEWRQLDGDSARLAPGRTPAGAAVTISRGALGSYNLEFVGQNALYKVRRTK